MKGCVIINRIKYVDTLKFIAIFSIILLHLFGIWDKVQMLDLTFYSIKECVRFGVPLFLMITGMLTLNKTIDLGVFLKKKFVRIVYPLAFFIMIGVATNIIHPPSSILTTYWYCWMIIGVYLAIPIINKFIANSSMKEIEYFLALFIITSLIYTLLLNRLEMALDLNFFIGPASYLILGYYLSKKDFKMSANKLVLINLIIFISITLYKIYNKDFLYMSANPIIYSLLNLSVPQIIQCSSLFLVFRYLYESSSGISGAIRRILENNYVNGFILSISRSSYGIYLFHILILRRFIEPYFNNMSTFTGFTTFVTVFTVGFAMLIVSWIAILILGKIPIVKKVSGYY